MVITVFPLQFPDTFLGWNTNLLRSDYAQIKMRLRKVDLLVYSQFCAIMANFTAHYCDKCLPFHFFNFTLIQPPSDLISAAVHQRHWRVMIISRPVGRTSPSRHTSVTFKCHDRNAPKGHNLLLIPSLTDTNLVPNLCCTYQLLIQSFGLDVSFSPSTFDSSEKLNSTS